MFEAEKKANIIEVECKNMFDTRSSLEVCITEDQQKIDRQYIIIEQLKIQL